MVVVVVDVVVVVVFVVGFGFGVVVVVVVVVVIFIIGFVVVVVAFVAFNFDNIGIVGVAEVEPIEAIDDSVMIGFFFCGGVGLVPANVVLDDCTVDANLVGVDCVVTEKKENFLVCLGNFLSKISSFFAHTGSWLLFRR